MFLRNQWCGTYRTREEIIEPTENDEISHPCLWSVHFLFYMEC